MGKLVYSLIVILLISFSILPTLTVSTNNAVNDKIHPLLLEKLSSLNKDDYVEVFIRVKPLPEDVKINVKGSYHRAVLALKTWASYTQETVIKEIIREGGVVLNRFWIDNLILARVRKNALIKLTAHPLVDRIYENFEVHIIEPIAKVNVSSVVSWGIIKIRAPEVWREGFTGSGVRIAVLDTGVDINHPALAGKMLTLDPTSPYYPGGWMEFNEDGNPVLSTPRDTHGHGTHCSGTALGGNTEDILIGVAPKATLMHALILHYGGGTWAQIVAGMQWAIEPFYIDPNTGQKVYTNLPAHVVSMSFGAYGYVDVVLEPIKNMLLANIIPVAAIGNGGLGTSASPGNVWGSFGIGATDMWDNVAGWSSGDVVYWPNPPSDWPFFDQYPSVYVKPDFSAPGVDIVSAVPGGRYEAWSGTSMAAPHVAGLVALVLQATGWFNYTIPDLPEVIYEIINYTSIDLGSSGQDVRYGWGRIDAYEAVKKALEYAKKTGVEGYVYDSTSREPVPWATVTVVELGKTFRVNKEGYFRIPLDPGVYTLLVEAWGYYSKNITVEVKLLNGTIVGHVLNYLDEPIPNASVLVHEINYTVITDEEGFFNISVKPGSYTLTASAPGYQSQTVTVNVGEAEVVYVKFKLFPLETGYIKGYVFDSTNGSPIVGANVTACSAFCYSAVTDVNGYYELEVYAGIYTVTAEAPGYLKTVISDVLVPPRGETWLNISLTPVPKPVVVLGNVVYATGPHLAEVISQLGLPVVEYYSLDDLLKDWANNKIVPSVVVVDHWYPDPYYYPDWGTLSYFIQLALNSNTSIVFLGTSYSGYTGIHTLYFYEAELERLGIPAPDELYASWPEDEFIKVKMLKPNHHIFNGVVPDGDDWFYLADIDVSYYADYLIALFLDDSVFNFEELAHVIDEYSNLAGVGVGVWLSPSGKPWFYLSSWGESYWMQYLESGWDGKYSDNTMIVLQNAVKLGYYGLGPKALGRVEAQSRDVEAKLYTYVEIYLDRLPHGFVKGRVIGSDGAVLKGAKIVILNTPIVLETDVNGVFYTWLPAGNYTALVTAPGYREELVVFTINVGVTTDLGDVVLIRVPRVAVYYDYNAEITRLLENYGLYSSTYTDLTKLIEDVKTGFYDLVIYAGTYGTPFPDPPTFFEFYKAVAEANLPVIWLDNWGLFGYGIKVLSIYTGDPAGFGYLDGAPMLIRIDKLHPITKGYSVGEVVQITTYQLSDFSWFYRFSGETVATQFATYTPWGGSIGWKISEYGSKWVLMSGFAPTPWTPMHYWTIDAYVIFYNAVSWALSRPLNVTILNPYLHVGDIMAINITGAPPYAKLNVFIDGMFITNITADERGNALVSIVIPLIPGGDHLLEVYTEDTLYHGYATFYILPKLVVEPIVVITPGLITVNITGLYPHQAVFIYVDGNWLTMLVADDVGVIVENINLPLLQSGVHIIKLVDASSLSTLYSVAIITVNEINELKELLNQLLDRLNNLETKLNETNAKFNELKEELTKRMDSVEAKLSELSNEVREIGEAVKNAISSINQSLVAINTKLQNITDTLLRILAKHDAELTGLGSRQVEQKRKLDDLDNKVNAMGLELLSVSDKASVAQNVSLAGLGLAIISLIAAIFSIFKKK